MKKTLLLSFLLFSIVSLAQVPKKVLVEHFTNTYCSTCANRNPGLYGNLANFPDLMHVAYHPSSPYPQCPLNQYNKQGNDNRANHYGAYGSTPRIVVNGVVIPAQTNYASSQFIDDVKDEMSNYSLELSWSQNGPNDSIRIDVKITLEGNSGSANGKIFLGLFQDTVYMTNQNGEKNPPHVYRGGPQGVATTLLPTSAGNSITYTRMLAPLQNLDGASLYAVAILYDEMDNYQQAERSASHTTLPTKVQTIDDSSLLIFPNPTNGTLYHSANKDIQVRILDLSGKTHFAGTWKQSAALELHLKPGVYLIQWEMDGIRQSERLLIRP